MKSYCFKPLSVMFLLFFVVFFLLFSCAREVSVPFVENPLEDTSKEGHEPSSPNTPKDDLTQGDSSSTDALFPAGVSLLKLIEPLPRCVEPVESFPEADRYLTLYFDESLTLCAKTPEGQPLPLMLTCDDSQVISVRGDTIEAKKAGITMLSVEAEGGSYQGFKIQVVVPPTVKLLSSVGSGWWYQQIQGDQSLSREKKNQMLGLYQEILKKPGTSFATGTASVVTYPGATLTYDELLTVFWAVKMDFPELFWVKGTFSPLFKGIEDSCYGLALGSMFATEEDFTSMVDLVEEKANELLSPLREELRGAANSRERLWILYKRLCDIPYEKGVQGNEEVARRWQLHCPYGALVDNLCVCDGYSSTLAYLVKKLRVEEGFFQDIIVSLIMGKPDSQKYPTHAWNMVKIGDDDWKELDITNATVQGHEANFMKDNNDRSFVLAHNLDINHKHILKYVPFAQERNKCWKHWKDNIFP